MATLDPAPRRLAPTVRLYGTKRTPVPAPASNRPRPADDTWADDSDATHDGPPLGHIGRYRLVEEVGRGGMGVVYKAWDPELSRFVGLKLLLGGGRAAQSQVERFLREARSAARLDHPNIVRVLDIGRYHEQVYFTMDFIVGTSVREALDEVGRLPVDESLRIVAGVARGLDHAHGNGVVHRDVKPANILLEVDGTPYITDFGLAKEADSEGAQITRSGQILGTPAYMPPEQAAGIADKVGPPADLYALGSVLYEMLAGRAPYDGESGIDVLVALLSGPPVPLRTHVPELPRDLEVIVSKAMARDPAHRYGSGRELADDVERYLKGEAIQARLPSLAYRARHFARRNSRKAAEITLTVASGVAMAFGWFAWGFYLETQDRAAIEARATERLTAVEQRIGELWRKGQHDEAERAFRSFIAVEEHRGTTALTRAWLHRALRMSSRGLAEEEATSYATAYSTASGPEHQAYALLGLARAFRRGWRWEQVEVVLDTLERAVPYAAGLPEVGSMRAEAALARRDPRAAMRWLAPLADNGASVAPTVAALADATATPHRATAAYVVDLDANGIDELAMLGEDGSITIVDASPELRVIRHHDLEPGLGGLVPVRREGADLLLGWRAAHGDSDATALLLAWDGESIETVLHWPEPSVLTTTAADLDGDGADEIYVGTGPYTRRLLQLKPRGNSYEIGSPSPALDAARSDVGVLAAGDLDGDGREELLVGVGAWTAYDLRVLRSSGAGALEVAARRRLGYVSAMATVPTAGGALLVAAKSDLYPSRLAFPSHAPYGDPAGLYLFELTEGGLSLAGHLAAPRPSDGEALAIDRLEVADVDGDGRVDLVACAASEQEHYLLVYQQLEHGEWARAAIGGLSLLTTAQLDADAAAELVVRATDGRTWVLGSGDAHLPALAPVQPPKSTLALTVATADPVLARSWQRAEDLAHMGLTRQAGDVLEDLAVLATGTGLEGPARYRAAELREREGNGARAAALYEEAAFDQRIAVDAIGHAIARHLEDHRFREALRLTDALLTRTDVLEQTRLAALARRSWLLEIVRGEGLELAFNAPIATSWQIADPLAMRRDMGQRALGIDAFSDQGVLASLPLRWVGPRLALTLDLTIDRTEWGSGLTIAVREQADPSRGIGFVAQAWGGGGLLERELGCTFPGGLQAVRETITSPSVPLRVRASVAILPDLGEVWCEIADEAGRSLVLVREPLRIGLSREGLELVIASTGESAAGAMWTSVRLERIAVDGATWDGTAREDAQAMAARRLVDAQPALALDALDEAASDPMRALWRAVALERIGFRGEAVQSLRKALASRDPAVDAAVARLLRSHADEAGPLVRQAAGDRYFSLYGRAWLAAIHSHPDDERVQQSLTSALRGLQTSSADSGLDLLIARGRTWGVLGSNEQARADLQRAISRAERLGPEATERLVLALRELAVVEAASGRPELALEHARRAVRASAAPELTIDWLVLQAPIAARRDEAGWSDLLGR